MLLMVLEVLVHGLLTQMPLDLWTSELSWLIPMVEKATQPTSWVLSNT